MTSPLVVSVSNDENEFYICMWKIDFLLMSAKDTSIASGSMTKKPY